MRAILLARATEARRAWLKVVFADSAYDRISALLVCFLLGLTLVVIRRLAGTKGFVLLPRRWVAERTLGWLGRWRRLAREYEELPEVSETMVKLAMIRLMLHPGFTHQVARVAEPAQQTRALVWKQAHSSAPMKL